MQHQIFLCADLSGNGSVIQTVRYLHATRDTMGEAAELCRDLNRSIVNVGYRVVEEE